jgi:hypothetical protein
MYRQQRNVLMTHAGNIELLSPEGERVEYRNQTDRKA